MPLDMPNYCPERRDVVTNIILLPPFSSFSSCVWRCTSGSHCTSSRSRWAWRCRSPSSRGCRRLSSCCTAWAGCNTRSSSIRGGTHSDPWSYGPAWLPGTPSRQTRTVRWTWTSTSSDRCRSSMSASNMHNLNDRVSLVPSYDHYPTVLLFFVPVSVFNFHLFAQLGEDSLG